MTSTISLALVFATLFLLSSCQRNVGQQTETRESTPRTVFGEPPALPVSSVERARHRTVPQVSEQKPRDEVSTMLYRWARTLTSRDLQRHMGLYAPKLDRFYNRMNVARASVRWEKQRQLRRSPSGQIRDVHLDEEDGGRLVIAEFVHERVRQRLVWKRQGPGEWRIIREEVM